MMQQIKNYLNKYHEANLWIAERMILEEKKQTIHAEPKMDEQSKMAWQPAVSNGQVVFSHYDSGHNEEERNKIQQLYSDLEDLVRMPRIAI